MSVLRKPFSVLVVIYDDAGQFLLLQRADDPNFWQSVTGGIDEGETPLQTAYRELKEETGIDCHAQNLSLTDHQRTHQYEIRPQWRHRYQPGRLINTEHVFSVKVPNSIPITLAAAEHLQFEWLSAAEAHQRAWSDSNKKEIMQLSSGLCLAKQISIYHDRRTTMLPTIQTLETPCLLVDKVAFLHNISMLESHLSHFEVAFRPHLKTVKSIDAASYITQPDGGCTVSTLKEAEVFAAAGYKDFTYAVGITEDKLPRVLDLINQGSRVTILLDSLAQAQFVHHFCEQQDCTIPCLIEIDCDGKRAGLNANDKSLIAIAKILANKGLYQGLLTHAGGAYGCTSKEEVAQFAERERSAVVAAAKLLENAGIATSVTSIGSTPTALCTQNLNGISEVRAGVYPFFDLVMAGVGVCDIEDIALSVLTRVTGVHSQDKRVFIDAGWMALSRDRGTASQQYDCGYGLVCNAQGNLIPGLKVVSASQEHGIIECEPGFPLPDIQHGELLRILPNHACATAAQHQGYHVFSHDEVAYWPRFTGW